MSPLPSVILIREWEEQLSGSGCCGRLEGHFLFEESGEGVRRAFPERRACMDAMGPLYRDLREAFGDSIEVHVVDPRNLLSVMALLIRDFWRFRVGPIAAIRTLLWLPIQAVVVNGRLVSRGGWPKAEVVVGLVDRATTLAPVR